jgi:hypothetical protein
MTIDFSLFPQLAFTAVLFIVFAKCAVGLGYLAFGPGMELDRDLVADALLSKLSKRWLLTLIAGIALVLVACAIGGWWLVVIGSVVLTFMCTLLP